MRRRPARPRAGSPAAPAPRRCGRPRAAPAPAPAASRRSTHDAHRRAASSRAQRAIAARRVGRVLQRPHRQHDVHRPGRQLDLLDPGLDQREAGAGEPAAGRAAAIAGAGSIPVTRCPAATSRAAHRPTPQPTSTTTAGAAPTTARADLPGQLVVRPPVRERRSARRSRRPARRRAARSDLTARDRGQRPPTGPPQHVGRRTSAAARPGSARSCCRSRRTPCGRTARARRGSAAPPRISAQRRVPHVRRRVVTPAAADLSGRVDHQLQLRLGARQRSPAAGRRSARARTPARSSAAGTGGPPAAPARPRPAPRRSGPGRPGPRCETWPSRNRNVWSVARLR